MRTDNDDVTSRECCILIGASNFRSNHLFPDQQFITFGSGYETRAQGVLVGGGGEGGYECVL